MPRAIGAGRLARSTPACCADSDPTPPGIAEALAGGGAAGVLGGGAAGVLGGVPPEMMQPEVTMPANAIKAIAASGRGASRRPYLQPGPGGLQGPAGCG